MSFIVDWFKATTLSCVPRVALPPRLVSQLEEENHRLQQAVSERDQRIAVLEAALNRSRQEKQHLVQENDALIRAMEALSAQ